MTPFTARNDTIELAIQALNKSLENTAVMAREISKTHRTISERELKNDTEARINTVSRLLA